MSKRVATYQISDRNPVDPSDEEGDGNNEECFNSSETENGRAKEEELRQRKYMKRISKPRMISSLQNKKPAPSLGNLFAGLPKNPFTQTVNKNDNEFDLKMRGLNKSFVESAQKLFERAPAADFSKLFDQYKDHLSSFSVNLKSMDIEPMKTIEPVKPAFESIKPVPVARTTSLEPSVDMPKPFTFKPIEPIKPIEPVMPIEITTIDSDSESESSSESNEEQSSFKPFAFEPLKPSPSVSFSFGSSVAAELKPESIDVPAIQPFTFGSSSQQQQPSTKVKSTESQIEAPSVPAFKPFTFGEMKPSVLNEISNVTESSVPAFKPFTFDSSTANVNYTETTTAFKPFTFGSTKIETEIVKPFSFGSTNIETDTVKPLSFSSAKIETETVKSFSFGSSAAEPVKPFSLGTSAPIGGLTPLPTFSFGAAPSTGGFSFSVPAVKTADQSGGEDDDEIPAEEAESFTLTRSNNDQLKTGAGEENETTQYEDRCKIFMMDTVNNGWIDLGVGAFKINRYNTDSGKSRVLCRAEGSGKVILNTLVSVPGTDVTRMEGKKEVAMLAIGSEGKPTKYLIRVKTLEQADALKSALSSEIEYVKSNKN